MQSEQEKQDQQDLSFESLPGSGKEIVSYKNEIERMAEVDKFSQQKLDKLGIIYPGMRTKKQLNVFRELRTQVLQRLKGKNFTCMITAVCDRGGSSFVAKNLGAAIALDMSKTSVLVDANLYSPELEELIVGKPNFGLMCHLSKKTVDVRDIVHATGVPRLRVIPIGSNLEGAAEYFSSEKMVSFVEELKERYEDRYVLIDSPPIGESSEAGILLDVCDLVILVVPYGKVTLGQVQDAVEKIGPDKLVGIVYNN